MVENLQNEIKVLVVGAGLAGVEVAHFLAKNKIRVILYESKRVRPNDAQKSPDFAELVCTNSLKSLKTETPHGLLKLEMEQLGSLVLKAAQEAKVPAGDSLAVDRHHFSQLITKELEENPYIEIIHQEVTDPEELRKKHHCQYIVLASGPLTLPGLESWICQNLAKEDFYFYDAIAPVVDAETIDYSKVYFKDRYQDEKEDRKHLVGDYLNAPMTKEEYDLFVSELVKAEKVPSKDFEKELFFESCLPIDVMAHRGHDTPRFSCMKPVGLGKENGDEPYAVVQMRRENLLGSAFNLVGFQTRLTYGEQKRVFRLIPGLENADFLHFGSVHRNSFLHAKKLLHFDLSSNKLPYLYFAGQMTGVEGYTESAAIGLYVGWQILQKTRGIESSSWPKETAIGALINYLMTAERPAPSNINFGLLPDYPLSKEERKSKARKTLKRKLIVERARNVLKDFLSQI